MSLSTWRRRRSGGAGGGGDGGRGGGGGGGGCGGMRRSQAEGGEVEVLAGWLQKQDKSLVVGLQEATGCSPPPRSPNRSDARDELGLCPPPSSSTPSTSDRGLSKFEGEFHVDGAADFQAARADATERWLALKDLIGRGANGGADAARHRAVAAVALSKLARKPSASPPPSPPPRAPPPTRRLQSSEAARPPLSERRSGRPQCSAAAGAPDRSTRWWRTAAVAAAARVE